MTPPEHANADRETRATGTEAHDESFDSKPAPPAAADVSAAVGMAVTTAALDAGVAAAIAAKRPAAAPDVAVRKRLDDDFNAVANLDA